MPYTTQINKLNRYQKFMLRIGEGDDIKSLTQNLKDSQITELDLIYSEMGCNDLKDLIQGLGDTQINILNLEYNNIMDEHVKYLTEFLKDTKIAKLNLSNNKFGCNGLKYLSQVLRDTQITILNLKNNNIMDEGVKHLADSLKDKIMINLDLTGNKIGIDAAQYLTNMLNHTEMVYCLDIYYVENGNFYKYISQTYCYNKINIIIRNNEIGKKGARYLNKTFQNIAQLKLDSQYLQRDKARCLARAFKGTKIKELVISSNHIMQYGGIQYLVQAFKDSQIAKLTVQASKMRNKYAENLAEFLREIKVLDLNLSLNPIEDEGMKYLAPVLKNSDIMYINLSYNNIKSEGARYLSEILQNSKIIVINLGNNNIGDDGARYLADGLPHSQVTGIHLYGNRIEFVEYYKYQFYMDIFNNTNLSWISLRSYDKTAGYGNGNGTECENAATVAFKIRNIFKELVSLNPMSNEFEFIVPRKNTLITVDIDQYAFLIRTLNDNPNSKVHIFDMMCKKVNDYDFDTMNKINEFIAIMPNKFNTFFNSKLPNLVESFGSYNYVNLVKQFEDMKLYDIVKNLLLHRVLYYVDENQEILHPYIYKMLDKYSMPLYNKQLEPNKKEQIIAYYQNNPEIDGVKEIIDLLGSESF